MTRQRILVCGATGFIGRNLVERFAQRPDVETVGVCHRRPPVAVPNVTWVQADLRVPSDVARTLEGVDVVIQAAAATSGAGDTVRAPHLHVADNAVMNAVLLRAAYEQAVRRFVFFSCSIMYAASPRPVRETDFRPGDPLLDAYFGAAWTKVYIEQMCDFYARQGRTAFTVIRHSNIYGPHDKFDLAHSHVFGATVTKVLEGRGPIVVWGDGREARDFLHVDDLVAFVDLALARQQSSFELLNAGSKTLVSVSELVGRIRDAAGVSRKIRYEPSAPTLKTSVSLDTTKAGALLGWEPAVTLDEGVRRTLAHRREVLASMAGESCHVPA